MYRLAPFIVAAMWMLCPASIVTRAQAPAVNRSATVEGIVVDSVSGQPIEGVHVAFLEGGQPLSEEGIQSLLSDHRPTVETPQVTKIIPPFILQGRTLQAERTTHSVVTDARGRFAFAGVAAGKYTVAFRMDGYTYQVYGQKSESVFVPPIDIFEGRNDLGKVQFRPEPQVDGRIIDASGAPITGMPVYLISAQPLIGVDGEKTFRAIGEAVTDANGKYVLKKIVAGRYFIAAGSSGRSAGIRERFTPDGGRSTEPITAIAPLPYHYYPGVADLGLAGQIELSAGNKLPVGDMVVGKHELRTIRGRVVDITTGKPPESIRVTLSGWTPFTRSGSGSREILSGVKYDRTTGVFEVGNLIPGRYRVDAVLPRQPIPGQPADALGDVSPRSAFQLLELTDRDINELVLSVPSNGRVTGKVVVSDGRPLPVDESIFLPIPLQLMFRPVTPLQPAPGVTSVSVQDGTFEVGSALEGKYRFFLGPLRENYYVSEARLDGVRAANGVLDIPRNVASELILTLSRGGEVQGIAVDRKGQPVRQAQGVVLPDPLPEIISFNQTIRADNEGRFFARNIPPGNYKIYVWEGADPPQFFDRELLARSAPFAFSIRLEKASTLTPTVPILAP